MISLQLQSQFFSLVLVSKGDPIPPVDPGEKNEVRATQAEACLIWNRGRRQVRLRLQVYRVYV